MSVLIRSFKGSGIARLLLSILCLLPALGTLTLFGQQDAGGLVVSVRDPSGAIVQGAKVVVNGRTQPRVDASLKTIQQTVATADLRGVAARAYEYAYPLVLMEVTRRNALEQGAPSGRAAALLSDPS